MRKKTAGVIGGVAIGWAVLVGLATVNRAGPTDDRAGDEPLDRRDTSRLEASEQVASPRLRPSQPTSPVTVAASARDADESTLQQRLHEHLERIRGRHAQLVSTLQVAVTRTQQLFAAGKVLDDRAFDLLIERDSLLQASDTSGANAALQEVARLHREAHELLAEGSRAEKALLDLAANNALEVVLTDYRDGNELRAPLRDAIARFLRGEIGDTELAASIAPDYIDWQAWEEGKLVKPVVDPGSRSEEPMNAFDLIANCIKREGQTAFAFWGTDLLPHGDVDEALPRLRRAHAMIRNPEWAEELQLALLTKLERGSIEVWVELEELQSAYAHGIDPEDPRPQLAYNSALSVVEAIRARLIPPSLANGDLIIERVRSALQPLPDSISLPQDHREQIRREIAEWILGADSGLDLFRDTAMFQPMLEEARRVLAELGRDD